MSTNVANIVTMLAISHPVVNVMSLTLNITKLLFYEYIYGYYKIAYIWFETHHIDLTIPILVLKSAMTKMWMSHTKINGCKLNSFLN